MGDKVADQVAAGEGKIADEIECFVADALIFHAELVIQRTFGPEYKQVLIGDTKAEATVA